VAYEGEVRFVTTIIDQQTFLMNAPFSALPAIGVSLQRAVTYRLGTRLPSISIYDYWDPITAVSRIISGAVVDTMAVTMQDGYHQFTFGGPTADLVDSANIGGAASAEIGSFPIEPAVATLNYSLVPGNSGELWIGTPAVQFLTVTDASVVLKNNVEFRNREFGSGIPRAFTCGRREILMRVSLLASDDAQTVMLYAAAKQRAALPMMLQLGSRPGQVMAIYLPKIIPDIPVYDDAQPRLAWDFLNNLGLGIANDELYVAFA